MGSGFILWVGCVVIFIVVYILMVLNGHYLQKKLNKLKSQAEVRGYEFGIYYELMNGEDAFVLIHKGYYDSENCLRKLRKEGNSTQVEDWEGRCYCFTVADFEKAVGEKINRQKFKIIKRPLKYVDNKNSPNLQLNQGFPSRLIYK